MNPIRKGVVAVVLLAGNWGWTAGQSLPAASYRESRLGSIMERARQFGYDDGLSDGANDHRRGYSFRPDRYDNYKKADRGCDFASKEQYRQIYRENYEQGYRRGYYGR